jgi:hypothetical protein
VVADRNRGAAFPAIGTASAGPLRPLPAEVVDRADRGDRPRVLPRTGPRRLVTADIAAAALGMGC